MPNPNRLIAITWTPVTDLDVTGYNVYLVHGAPINDTKVLLAFVSGVTSNGYNYTAVEGTDYQFEVRATNGVNEGPPLAIFYPDGTSLYTPTAITPTGQPMMNSRDVAYITKDEFLNFPTGLKLTTSSPLYVSGMLDNILSSASEQVNRFCRRHFNVQTIDEVYHGVRIGQDMPKLITIPLNEGPIQVVNRVDIQVLKYFINFSLDYLQIYPENNYIQIVPFLGGGTSGLPLPSAATMSGMLGKVWVNYTYGFNVPPFDIKMATSLYATYMIGLQENPVGATSVRFGRNFQLNWDKNTNPILDQAERMLKPYRMSTYRRP